MRILYVAVAGLLACGLLAGQPPAPIPKPTVRFPEFREPVLPTPAPGSAIALATDEWYVIDSDEELFPLVSPAGGLTVAVEQGPQTVKGKFVGGGGKTETRKFAGKFLYFVEAASAQRCELIVVPKGVTAEAAIVRKIIDANKGPQPPPKPIDPVDPPKPVDPAPIPDVGFRVLVVFETGMVLPAPQNSILYGKTVREYLDAHCAADPDGKTKGYRIWDKDTVADADFPVWKTALARPRKSVPWVIVSNGKAGYEGPLPASVADMMALLKKYAEGN